MDCAIELMGAIVEICIAVGPLSALHGAGGNAGHFIFTPIADGIEFFELAFMRQVHNGSILLITHRLSQKYQMFDIVLAYSCMRFGRIACRVADQCHSRWTSATDGSVAYRAILDLRHVRFTQYLDYE